MRSIVGDMLQLRLGDAADGPMNQRLYRAVREAILDGTLPAHTRLPPTRDLAGELGVSRNTVLYAYDQLAAEGCLVSRTGSGSFVADLSADRFIATPPAVGTRAPSPAPAPLPSGVSARGEALLGRVSATDVQWGAFLPGVAVAMLLGRFWKRVNWQGGLACIGSGTLLGVLILVLPSFKNWINATMGGPAVPATIISLVFGIVVSLMFPADTTPDDVRLKHVMDDRRGTVVEKVAAAEEEEDL